MMRNAEAEVIDLATRIAEKILDEQIKVDPEVVVAVAKRAIELAIDREHIVVRINPADREMMRRHKAEMFASTDGVKNIQVVADQGVRQGGCIIETNSGNVDAQLASQLAQVEECLRGAIDGERGQPN
jgi:flagellar assembly protein FliH